MSVVAYRVKKENLSACAAEIRPLTTDKDVAAKLRRAMGTKAEANGDAIICIEPTDEFAEIVKKYGEIAR